MTPPNSAAATGTPRARKSFLRDNWFWIALPFLLIGGVVVALLLTTDLSQVFGILYTPR